MHRNISKIVEAISKNSMTTLYQQIADKIIAKINQGLYKPGERLPGVRQLSQEYKVSISTIIRAHSVLEDRHAIAAKPRSGFYISAIPTPKIEIPKKSSPVLKPVPVKAQGLVLDFIKSANQPLILQLGAAVPHDDFLPLKAINKSISKLIRQQNTTVARYEFPPGNLRLRQQIAKRMLLAGFHCAADDIIITNGCHESLSFALRTVAKSGDIIAVESPVYYGLLEIIEALGMKALEIPTDPSQGISLSALKLTLEKWKLGALILVPNFNNPLGYCMPDSRKKKLVQLLSKHKIPVIEDDIYGELGFELTRPSALKAYDKSNNVIYCSSFSKSINPGFRIGWIIPGNQYIHQIEYQKYVSNLASPTLLQHALADFLEHGGYDRYLRKIRQVYQNQIFRVTQAIIKYFPNGTKITQPQGGFTLWVELPKKIDCYKLYEAALTENINIAPGSLFSSRKKYRNFIRISCAQPWNQTLDNGLLTLGKLVHTMYLT